MSCRIGLPAPVPGTGQRPYILTNSLILGLVHARLTVGHYEVTWEAERDMASGVYVYRLVAGGQVLTRTMLLLK